ncbi:hypothetical protein EVI01_22740 [Enterococcus villorum]|uniref:Uncharacterized protein n=1 Tax=Enterococcus villorum TaxID=112904 RepID=A0A511J4K7_9ENTE|nr:hypothetical protein EVI01_22740 [Enterococcus villorum]
MMYLRHLFKQNIKKLKETKRNKQLIEKINQCENKQTQQMNSDFFEEFLVKWKMGKYKD